ncbi:hypothetical protein ACEWY4_011975 [Coilia grayii]|uniref:V-SNARE coiled-coil homology domain-containing protein n=1 Tax=Coilia grayii TaxID=363190 RepID=A0ABD1JZ59_9TELE
MLDNLNKAEERTGKLGELENRADELLKQGQGFAKTAAKVKRKKQWENIKLKVLIGGMISVVIVVIILVAVLTNTDSTGSEGPKDSTTQAP